MKIKYLGMSHWPDIIGSFCGIWKKGEIRDIRQKDAEFLLKHHSLYFKRIE